MIGTKTTLKRCSKDRVLLVTLAVAVATAIAVCTLMALPQRALASNGRTIGGDNSTIFAWGANDTNTLGTGTWGWDARTEWADKAEVPLPPGVEYWKDFRTGIGYTLAVAQDGRLFTWGVDFFDIGSDPSGILATPTEVPLSLFPGVTGWRAAGGNQHSHMMLLTDDGRIFHYSFHTIGSQHFVELPFPPGVTEWTDLQDTVLFTPDGRIFVPVWSSNPNAVDLGGRISIAELPPPSGTTWGRSATPGSNFLVTADGRAFTAPISFNSPLVELPKPAGVTGWEIVHFDYAICTDGRLFKWRMNNSWTAVDGVDEIPIPAGSTGWASVQNGMFQTVGLSADGRLFIWGNQPWNSDELEEILLPEGYAAWSPQIITGGWSVQIGEYHFFVQAIRETEPELPMTKNLVVPQAAFTPMPTPAPIFTFDFTFTPVQILLETDPDMLSMPVAQFADVVASPQEVAVNLSTAPIATNSAATPPTYAFAGELCLWELFEYHESDFPGAGIYVWNIAEVAGSSGTTSPSSMQYSTERFQVWVWIDRDNELLDIRVFPITGGTGPNYTLGTKRDNMTFTNTYSRVADVDLEITKYVEGLLADLTTPFTFDLTLTGATVPPSIVAVIYAYNDAVPPVLAPTGRTVTIANGQSPQPGGFTLYHGDRLIVRNLPVGTTFNVTERAQATFWPEVEVFLAGASVFEDYETFNTAISTGNHTITTGTGRNAADFTNHFTLTPPETGIFINNNMPLLIAAVLAAGLAVYVVQRNRKKIEELPL